MKPFSICQQNKISPSLFILLFFFLFGNFSFCQPANDDCPGAILLSQTGYCNPVSGTTVNATQSIPAIYCLGLAGYADDDVWYKFTAVTTSPTVVVMCSPTFDAVIDLRADACDGNNINCADYKGPGGTETIYTGSLLVGSTYLVRVYSFGSGTSTQGTFSICVYGLPPYPPSNDDCIGSQFIENPTFGTTTSASQSAGPVTCNGITGDSDDDVWYNIVPSIENQTIQVEGAQNFDPVVDLREGFCDGITIGCADATGQGGFETIKATGLSPGSNYHVRVYSYGSGTSAEGEFTINVYPSVCPTCPSYDFALSPATTWQTNTSSVYSLGCNMYAFNVTSGNEYIFKTGCGDGAMADFNTWLELYDDECNTILINDNGCEQDRSIITWEATYTGYVYLKISGTEPAEFGAYTLAYHTPYPVIMDEPTITDPVVIFPNPASGSFVIKAKYPVKINEIKIIDLTGRIIYKKFIEKETQLFSFGEGELETGTYIIVLETSEGTMHKSLEIIW